MKIVYSRRASRDLAEIGDYLRERNPSGAAKVEARIRAVVELTADFPASGREVDARPGVRVIPLGVFPYLIF